ncbi:MAG: hypothetical protein GWN58_11185 [Anaerolineae bacterium]|nr:hypothetical protein [Anaerolineae bacterium]
MAENETGIQVHLDMLKWANDAAGTAYESMDEVPKELWIRLAGAMYLEKYSDILHNPLAVKAAVEGKLQDREPFMYVHYEGDLEEYLATVDEELTELWDQVVAAVAVRTDLPVM